MTQKPESQERPAANQADRHLDTANRCLVRQLRVLSRLGRHPPQVKLARLLKLRAGVSPGQDQNDSRRTLRTLRGRFLPLESPAPANALRVCMTLSGSQAASQ
jgi:hypothetical protein